MPDTASPPKKVETQKPRSNSPFQSLQDEIERMFHAFSLPELSWRAGMPGSEGTLGLRINVSESDTAIQVTADLPGVQEDDIDVTLEGDLLRISAEKSAETEKEEKTWHVVERSYGRYERAMHVPAGIDPDSIKAGYKDGVLTIDIPKPAEMASSTRKIAVSSD